MFSYSFRSTQKKKSSATMVVKERLPCQVRADQATSKSTGTCHVHRPNDSAASHIASQIAPRPRIMDLWDQYDVNRRSKKPPKHQANKKVINNLKHLGQLAAPPMESQRKRGKEAPHPPLRRISILCKAA
jgi:hypothetical protein